MGKGQVAIEFLMYASAFMLAFLVVVLAFTFMGRTEIKTQNHALAREVGRRLVNVFAVLASVGEGSCYVFSLPPSINNFDYNITLVYRVEEESADSSGFVLSSDGTEYVFELIPIKIYVKEGVDKELMETSYRSEGDVKYIITTIKKPGTIRAVYSSESIVLDVEGVC